MTDLDQPLAPDAPAAPHSASGEQVATSDLSEVAPAARPARRWVPRRVVATPPAYDHPHGLRIMARLEARGIEVERLRSARLTGVRGETDRETYARAKSTMAIVVSPPSRRKLQPIAPSADWRFDLAEFDDVATFAGLAHHGRTRVRFSVNCLPVTTRFEGGTSRLRDRLAALRRLALDGYPVGLTIAPIMGVPDWRTAYGTLLAEVAAAVDGVPGLDLTAELITHRFTPGSKEVLLGWYPRSRLEMDEPARARKHGKFGAVKYVYPAELMSELRGWFHTEIARQLPGCRILYWT